MTTPFVANISNPPSKDLFVDKTILGDDTNHRNWIQFMNQVASQINLPNYYGNPSECLNSDFNWQRGIATPVTQANGDGAYISEKWQIHGAAVATYTITSTQYAATADYQSASKYYEHVVVSNYAGNGTLSDFYIYQQTTTGSNFLRLYQLQILNFSTLIVNNQTAAINMKFEILFHYDGSADDLYESNTFDLTPGENYMASDLITSSIANKTVGAGAYVQFRLVFCKLNANTADIDVRYIKCEIANQPTALYVDHALEKTRIDNS
ncbi:MAG: hypothetical protein EKK56_00955 [Flavobacteriaceae bacterium]|nr:MAG: hypothetical protein EKK56_00955 [Flavobacteriaceae bacterium]